MLSHELKTIFVHIPKCAGQSVEQAFLNEMKLTWDLRHRLILRKNDDRSLGPDRLAHLFAREYYELGYVDKITYDSYYKFSIVRNPIHRIISELNYRLTKENEDSLSHKVNSIEEYVEKAITLNKMSDRYRHVCRQTEYVFDCSNRMIVDDIIKFEGLPLAFSKINMRKFDGRLALLKRNVTETKKWRVDEIKESDINFIADFYKEDFITFNY